MFEVVINFLGLKRNKNCKAIVTECKTIVRSKTQLPFIEQIRKLIQQKLVTYIPYIRKIDEQIDKFSQQETFQVLHNWHYQLIKGKR